MPARWLLIFSLLIGQFAHAQEPPEWTIVGALNERVLMLSSIDSDRGHPYLNTTILLKKAPGSPRELPATYHPDGGALLWSHSVYYESASRAIWIDGKSFLHLGNANIVMLVESDQAGQPPRIAATEVVHREFDSAKAVTVAELRESLLRLDSVREFAYGIHKEP